MRPNRDFMPLDEKFDPFEENSDKFPGFPREQIDIFGGDEVPSKEAWLKEKEADKLKLDRERRLLKQRECSEVELVQAENMCSCRG